MVCVGLSPLRVDMVALGSSQTTTERSFDFLQLTYKQTFWTPIFSFPFFVCECLHVFMSCLSKSVLLLSTKRHWRLRGRIWDPHAPDASLGLGIHAFIKGFSCKYESLWLTFVSTSNYSRRPGCRKLPRCWTFLRFMIHMPNDGRKSQQSSSWEHRQSVPAQNQSLVLRQKLYVQAYGISSLSNRLRVSLAPPS